MAAIITVALGVTGFFYLRFLEDSLRHSIFAGLESVARTSSDAVSIFLSDSMQKTRAIALALPQEALEHGDSGAVEEKLKDLAREFPEFENGLFILDSKGNLWVDYPAHPQERGSSFAFRDYFKRTIEEGRGVIGVPYVSFRSNEPVLTFTSLLRAKSGRIIGVLGCSAKLLSPKTFEFIRKTKIGSSGYLYVSDSHRTMILHPDSRRVLEPSIPKGMNALLDAAVENGFQGAGETVNSRGVPMLACASRIAGTDWVIVAQQPKKEAYAPISAARNRIFFGIVICALAALVVTLLCMQRITAPFVRLRNAAVGFARCAAEDGPACPLVDATDCVDELKDIRSKDEIGDLASAFREMYERLDQTLGSLRSSAADWENTFNSVPDAIFLLDRESRIRRLNLAGSNLLAKETNEVIGNPCYRMMHGAEFPPAYCPHVKTLSTGKVAVHELEDPACGRFLKVTTAPLVDKAGNITGTVHVSSDITQRKKAEESLRKAEEILRALIEAAPVAIVLLDAGGKVMLWNPAAERMFGWREEEVIGRFHPLIPEEERAEFLEFLKGMFEGRTCGVKEVRRLCKDGSLLDVSLSISSVRDAGGGVIGSMGLFVDITERKQAEEERKQLEAHLRQAQKMEAIGTLAGGIAHDFNNILAAILGFTELTIRSLPEESPLERNLLQVMKAGDRAKELVKQILTFSRQTDGKSMPVRVSSIVEEALKLLRASLPATIEIKTDIAADPGTVLADPIQIHQVLMNLCTNAAHAMEEKGGVMEVSLRAADLGAAAVPSFPEIGEGTYLELTVRDAGQGMDRATMERIFDPYFTTKQKGVGTGLGLAVVRGIVRSCGGAITVESEKGVGSAFHLFFPVTGGQAVSQPDIKEPAVGGTETILFVDDETALVDAGRQMLESLGYKVVGRSNAMEALDVFRAEPSKFDLVITDMTMPTMTGIDLAGELVTIRPGIAIILCTGYSENALPKDSMTVGIREYAMKPLLLNDLAGTIRRVLDKKSNPECAKNLPSWPEGRQGAVR